LPRKSRIYGPSSSGVFLRQNLQHLIFSGLQVSAGGPSRINTPVLSCRTKGYSELGQCEKYIELEEEIEDIKGLLYKRKGPLFDFNELF
jgi:hypothetical protein